MTISVMMNIVSLFCACAQMLNILSMKSHHIQGVYMARTLGQQHQ